MSQDTRDNLFGRMSYPSLLGTNEEKGTGLGLMLVKDFVLQHGGRIWVDSEQDKGTCFYFTMPAVKEIVESDVNGQES
jgi:signal transduction histidine kinase